MILTDFREELNVIMRWYTVEFRDEQPLWAGAITEELTERGDMGCPTINRFWRGMIKKNKEITFSKNKNKTKQVSGLTLEGYYCLSQKCTCPMAKGSQGKTILYSQVISPLDKTHYTMKNLENQCKVLSYRPKDSRAIVKVLTHKGKIKTK